MNLAWTHPIVLIAPAGEEDDQEIEVLLYLEGSRGCPARVRYDQWDHPAEDGEVELTGFQIWDSEKRAWRCPNLDPMDFLNDCHIEQLVLEWWNENSEQVWESCDA